MRIFAVLAAFASSTAAASPPLYIECSGRGSPVVVLEAGANRTSTSWARVIPPLTKLTRVCAYDREGSGRSVSKPPHLVRHTALADARALHDLLDAVGERPPYLLVGHSYGALVVRQFAATFRSDVAGVTFVDSPHEDYAIELAKLTHEAPPTYPPEGPIDWPTTFSQMRKIATLGDLPLTVLTAGEIPDGETPASVELWRRLQMNLSALSSRGKQRTIAHTGHMIPTDAPDAIVDAVREMIAGIRAPSNATNSAREASEKAQHVVDEIKARLETSGEVAANLTPNERLMLLSGIICDAEEQIEGTRNEIKKDRESSKVSGGVDVQSLHDRQKLIREQQARIAQARKQLGGVKPAACTTRDEQAALQCMRAKVGVFHPTDADCHMTDFWKYQRALYALDTQWRYLFGADAKP